MKTGHFHTVEEVIAEALQALRRGEQNTGSAAGKDGRAEAVRQMLEFVEKNRVRLEGVSVKDLIHEGHRL